MQITNKHTSLLACTCKCTNTRRDAFTISEGISTHFDSWLHNYPTHISLICHHIPGSDLFLLYLLNSSWCAEQADLISSRACCHILSSSVSDGICCLSGCWHIGLSEQRWTVVTDGLTRQTHLTAQQFSHPVLFLSSVWAGVTTNKSNPLTQQGWCSAQHK